MNPIEHPQPSHDMQKLKTSSNYLANWLLNHNHLPVIKYKRIDLR